jgi:hypothetical protein
MSAAARATELQQRSLHLAERYLGKLVMVDYPYPVEAKVWLRTLRGMDVFSCHQRGALPKKL